MNTSSLINNRMFIISALIICLALTHASPLSVEQKSPSHHLKFKRSPYLRLDELSTKLYLAKNKLGGGYLDPLEIGKRSASSSLSSSSSHQQKEDTEVELAIMLYDGLLECISREKCSRALKVLLDN